MENLKSVLTLLIQQTRPYWIYAGCFVGGVVVGLWL
jgi:hypothetical protein